MNIQWESDKNIFFLNPRLPLEQRDLMLKLLEESRGAFKGHLFLMTSGTTSQGARGMKWIALSQNAVLTSAAAVNAHLRSTKSDTWIQTLPEFHVGGIGIEARGYLSGARVVTLAKWNAYDFVKSIQENEGTLSALVPTQIYDLVQNQLRCPESLRALIVGGGAFSYFLFQKAKDLGWPVIPSYGMTETSSQAATAEFGIGHYENCEPGLFPRLRVLSHLQIRVGDDDRIQIKGGSLLSASIYWNEDRAVLDRHETDGDGQGWYLTQDRGRMLGPSSMVVFGRTNEFVKIGGESVELTCLRSVLEELKLEYVKNNADVELIPVPDERLGHVIGLISELRIPPKDAENLILSFNQRVLPFEKIRVHKRVEKIPRTELGKLRG